MSDPSILADAVQKFHDDKFRDFVDQAITYDKVCLGRPVPKNKARRIWVEAYSMARFEREAYCHRNEAQAEAAYIDGLFF